MSSLTYASQVNKVRGVVLDISPMKEEKSGIDFFDGRLGDDNVVLRFTGYDSRVRHCLVECKRKGGAVIMSNCEVKASHSKGYGLEVHI